MKHSLKILTFIILPLLIIGSSSCGNLGGSGSQLFTDFSELTTGQSRFEGYALVEDIDTPIYMDGPCFMTLGSDNKLSLEYNLVDYILGKQKSAIETFTVSDFTRKSIEQDGIRFDEDESSNLSDTYLYGSVEGLESSIDGVSIEDGSGTGEIWFVLDSVNSKLNYYMANFSNWSFEGGIALETNQYIQFKELFINRKLSEEEAYAAIQSRISLKFHSASDNFKAMGNNKYKVQISKKELIEKQQKDMHDDQVTWNATVALKPAFSCFIENASKVNLDLIGFGELYPDIHYSTLGADLLRPLRGSDFSGGGGNSRPFSQDKSEKKYFLYYNLTMSSSGWTSGRPRLTHLRKNVPFEEILADENFIGSWNECNKTPFLRISVRNADTKEWVNDVAQIYLELVD